jgi:hypothetical protein
MTNLARPQFFEGQYIGAADLEQIVEYARIRQAQHLLSGHSWGIAAGLDLLERPSPDGSVEVWVQPGHAWDGYGRAVTVPAATLIGLDQLRGKPGGAWFVWLAYREAGRDAARPGYGVCSGEDLYLRMDEGFEILVTGSLALRDQQSGVLAGDLLRADARLARRAFDPDGPFLCDASVPEQGEHPEGGRARWLIPLGLIGWDSAAQRIVPLSPAERQGARLLRRHVGSVAESLYAPAGLLRLRDRLVWQPPGTQDTELDKTCAAAQPLTTDLVETGGRVAFDDLVWVEGNMRVLGHGRLYGGRLELRAQKGAAPQGPMFLRRKPGAPGDPQDLDLAIGARPAGGVGPNRLVVGPVQDPNADPLQIDPVLAVLASGKVGIGTGLPALTLDVKGDFGRDDGPATVHLKGSRVGDAGDGILLLTSGGSVISLGGDETSDDRIGIRTKAPAADLALEVKGAVGITSNPAQLKLIGSEVLDAGDGILRIRSGGGTVTFDGGDRIGIGTAAPQRALHVEAPALAEVHSGGGSGGFSFADRFTAGFVEAPANGERWVWYAAAGSARLWSGSDRLTLTSAGRLGLGIGAPTATLDVAGDVRVGAGASIGGSLSVGSSLGVGGNATIGNDLTVNGDLLLDGLFIPISDLRLKRDIAPIAGALGQLLALRGVRFHWVEEALAARRPGEQLGLIADEVEKVFPDWVRRDDAGHKRLSTQGLEALTIEALRELSGRVERLEAENRQLADTVATLRRGAAATPPRAKRSRKTGGGLAGQASS